MTGTGQDRTAKPRNNRFQATNYFIRSYVEEKVPFLLGPLRQKSTLIRIRKQLKTGTIKEVWILILGNFGPKKYSIETDNFIYSEYEYESDDVERQLMKTH